jgi:hypothetical protein
LVIGLSNKQDCMKKYNFYILLYFIVIAVVASLVACSPAKATVRKPDPCPQFGKSHPRDMPYAHPVWR